MCDASLIAWRSWKLRRVAIGTNDAEIQSIVECKDVSFPLQLLWSELHANGLDVAHDFQARANAATDVVHALLGTDSKGGFDSIIVNEGSNLGLSSVRSAIQAYQLKQFIDQVRKKLNWIAGDWNLSDGLTKKASDSRRSLETFLGSHQWAIKYDPNFVVSARKARKQLAQEPELFQVDTEIFSLPRGRAPRIATVSGGSLLTPAPSARWTPSSSRATA